MYGRRMNEEIRRGLAAAIGAVVLWGASLLVAGGGDSAIAPFRFAAILCVIVAAVLLVRGLLAPRGTDHPE